MNAIDAALIGQMTAWRWHLQAAPKLGFKEFATADFAAPRLAELGLEVHCGLVFEDLAEFNGLYVTPCASRPQT